MRAEVVGPKIAGHHGRIVNTTGYGCWSCGEVVWVFETALSCQRHEPFGTVGGWGIRLHLDLMSGDPCLSFRLCGEFGYRGGISLRYDDLNATCPILQQDDGDKSLPRGGVFLPC